MAAMAGISSRGDLAHGVPCVPFGTNVRRVNEGRWTRVVGGWVSTVVMVGMSSDIEQCR